jgi:hypothetical protein
MLSEQTAMLRSVLLAVFLDLKSQVQSVRVQETGNRKLVGLFLCETPRLLALAVAN